MPTPCLARVFGPTIVGSCNSDPNAMLKDVQKQQMVREDNKIFSRVTMYLFSLDYRTFAQHFS